MAVPDPGSLRGKHAAVLAPAKKEEIRKHVQELLSHDYSVRAAPLPARQPERRERLTPGDRLFRDLSALERVFPKPRK